MTEYTTTQNSKEHLILGHYYVLYSDESGNLVSDIKIILVFGSPLNLSSNLFKVTIFVIIFFSQVAYYINENVGPYVCQSKKAFLDLWSQSRPYFQHLGEWVIEIWKDFQSWCQKYLPPLIDYIHKQILSVFAWLQQTFQSVMS